MWQTVRRITNEILGVKGLKTLVTDFGSSEIKSLNPLTPISD